MEENNKRSLGVVIIFWLATIICFIFGFYNTHLGLRTFKAFGGEGSWIIAAVILALVVGGYIAAVQRRKGMLALYLTGEFVFFVFNLTYLYPNYLGRTLIQEEATTLKDSLVNYQNRIDNYHQVTGEEMDHLHDLEVAQKMLLEEIKGRNGFGKYATEQLNIINNIAGTNYTPPRNHGKTQQERDELYKKWKDITDEEINKYTIRLIDDKNAVKWVHIRNDIDSISKEYNDKLEIIIADNSDVEISHDAVANNSQILVLKNLTTKLDKVAEDFNSIAPYSFNKIVTGKETIAFPKVQSLGTFQHTMISVRDRLGKLDTWGVIFICFFFDLLGPFLFYFYLRKNNTEEPEDWGEDDKNWWERWWKRSSIN